MKKEYVELQNEIENVYLAYEGVLIEYAKVAFNKYVKWYLINNKLSMLVGMGGYSIFNPKLIKSTDSRDEMDYLPQRILDILELEVPCASSNNTLGCWMPSFEYKEER